MLKIVIFALFVGASCDIAINITKENHDQLMLKLPLLCPRQNEIARILINHDYHCSSFLNKKDDHLNIKVLLYRPNIFEYEQDAVMCKRVITQLTRRCVDWFADIEENYDAQWTEPVPYSECESLNSTKFSQHEKAALLPGFGNSWQTIIQPIIPETSCLHHKTKYSTPPVSNVFLMPTKVSQNLHGHMISPSGSMGACGKFSDGHCERFDNTTLIWEAPSHYKDRLIPYKVIDAYMSDNVIISVSGAMGLTNWTTHDVGMHFNGEVSANGQNWEKVNEPTGIYRVYKSIQGVYFSIIPVSKSEKPFVDKVKDSLSNVSLSYINKTEIDCKDIYNTYKNSTIDVINTWFVSDIIPSYQSLSIHRCFELMKTKAVEYFTISLNNVISPNDLSKCTFAFYSKMLELSKNLLMPEPEDKRFALWFGRRDDVTCLEMGGAFKELLLLNVRDFQIFGRKKRETESESTHLADTAETTSTIQFVLAAMSEEINDSQRKIAHQMCRIVEQSSRHLTSVIDSDKAATKYARSITGINNIAARVYGSYMVITSCTVIRDFHFLPMGSSCSLNVPFNFTATGRVISSFMDPDTRITTSDRRPISCSSSSHIVVDFDPPVVISGITGAHIDLKFSDFHIFDKFEDIMPNGIIPIPEMSGIDMGEFVHNTDHYEEALEFASNLRKGLAQITGKPGPGQHNEFDPNKFISGLWHWSFIGLITPSFEDSPFIRLWIILVCLEATIKFILQFVLPTICTFYYVNYAGIGKIFEHWGPGAKNRRRRRERDSDNAENIEML